MKTKLISISMLIFILTLNACSPFTIATSSGKQPIPVVEIMPPAGYQAVTVSQVEVEVGVGSPIPVYAIVSGNLPDTCAQVELVQQEQVGSVFQISLSTISSSAEGCIQDSLPFRMSIPLNVVNLPAGSYNVEVNGSQASFELETGNTTSSVPAAGSVSTKDEIQVDSVNIEIGVGSPIPVHAIVSLNLPNTCAQLGEVRLHRDGATFFVRLIAAIAERVDCQADSIPFRLEVPLNIVNLPDGLYEVNVNGVTASFDPRATPASPSTESVQLIYIGEDGNVWFQPDLSAEPQQVTTDATSRSAGAGIIYSSPQISGDGEWVAYRSDEATSTISGQQYIFGLWVYNLESGESQQILDENPAGLAWKPGTHLLAYGLGVPEGYFSFDGENPIDSSLARGLMGFDADSGETIELVQPERGYVLYGPQWSPDGRFLSFEELVYIEGRGLFAYYDFEAGTYAAWEEAIGNYDWSADASQIIYDRLNYVETGTEEIFARLLQGGDEQRLTDYPAESEYAFSPALSPGGDRLAYLAGLEDPDSQSSTLFVQDLAGGEPVTLGSFEEVRSLAWSPDGEQLLFSAGPWETQELIAVNIADGSAVVLAPGTAPNVACNTNK